MQFEVQGQDYFLKFHPGEGRWYLLKPTRNGITGMAVLDDGGPATGMVPIPEEEDEQKSVVN
ncbi:MAG: hypothetical protein ABSD88_18400 [Candidatus Korobacteraceae bacterium]|jgi:hypothetical protein